MSRTRIRSLHEESGKGLQADAGSNRPLRNIARSCQRCNLVQQKQNTTLKNRRAEKTTLPKNGENSSERREPVNESSTWQ